MPKICFVFIILLMIAQPVVFANNDLNKEETQKATIEFVNFFSYRFNNLQHQITDVTQKNLKLEANLEGLVNFFSYRCNNLQNQIADVTQKNLELEAKLEELQKQLVSNKEQITALTQENLELKAKIEESQKQLVSNYAILQEQHSANKVELEKVKEEMVSSSKEVKENYVSKAELENLIKDIIQTFNALIDKLLGKAN